MLTNANGIPLRMVVDAANTPGTRMGLAVATMTLSLLPCGVRTPVLADKVYDDDWLRKQFGRMDLVLVAKHRCNRVKAATSDGRRERRLKRR